MAYHIKNDGTPGVCKAQKGNCPLAGAEGHFDTLEQAQEYAEIANSNSFGILGGVRHQIDPGHEELGNLEVEDMSQFDLEFVADDINSRIELSDRTLQPSNGYWDRISEDLIDDERACRNAMDTETHALKEAEKSLRMTNKEIAEWSKTLDPEMQTAVASLIVEPTVSGKLAPRNEINSVKADEAQELLNDKFLYNIEQRRYNAKLKNVDVSNELHAYSKFQLMYAIEEAEVLAPIDGHTPLEKYGDPRTLSVNRNRMNKEINTRKALKNLGLSDNFSQYEPNSVPANELTKTSFGRVVNAYAIDNKGRVDRVARIDDNNRFITERGFVVSEQIEERIFIDHSIKGK